MTASLGKEHGVEDGSGTDRFGRELRVARHLAAADAAGILLPDGSTASHGQPFAPGEALLAAVRLKQHLLINDPSDQLLAGAAMGFFAGVRLDLPGSTEGGVLWVAGHGSGEREPTLLAALIDLAGMVASTIATADSLALGQEIQKELLPAHPPVVRGYELAAHSLPSQELGGDFYDWWLVEGHLRLVLADVMGKGVGSSIIAAGVRSMLHAALTYHSPADAVTRVGGDLETDFDRTARFATCFVGDLDPATGQLRYVDAGHGIAVIVRSDGGYEHLAAADLPLGSLPGLRWQQQTTRLAPGDVLLVASDGVLERYERLSDVLDVVLGLYREHLDLGEIVARVGGTDPADDDITIIGVQRDRHLTPERAGAEPAEASPRAPEAP